MSPLMRRQGRFGQRILLLTTAVVLLTGLLRRGPYTAGARLQPARRDDVAMVMVDVVVQAPAARLEQRVVQPVRMLHTPIVLEDGRTIDVVASLHTGLLSINGRKRAA